MKYLLLLVCSLMSIGTSLAQADYQIQNDVNAYVSFIQSQLNSFSANAKSVVLNQVNIYYDQYVTMRNLVTQSVANLGEPGTSCVQAILVALDNNINQLQIEFSDATLSSTFNDFQKIFSSQLFSQLPIYANQWKQTVNLKPSAISCWNNNRAKISDTFQKFAVNLQNEVQMASNKLTQTAQTIASQVNAVVNGITGNFTQCQSTQSANDCVLKYVRRKFIRNFYFKFLFL